MKIYQTYWFFQNQHVPICCKKQLRKKDFPAEAIHGQIFKMQDNAFGCFQKQEVGVLVATDIAARGIDIASFLYNQLRFTKYS